VTAERTNRRFFLFWGGIQSCCDQMQSAINHERVQIYHRTLHVKDSKVVLVFPKKFMKVKIPINGCPWCLAPLEKVVSHE
jgi:hypothetical protein